MLVNLMNKSWYEISEKYCEHYEVGNGHYGELKRLKKDAPNYAKKLYSEQIKIWKKKGYELPEDAEEYL